MQPFVVRRIISPDGEELVRAAPQRRRRVISDSVARVLRQLLAGVVERGTGTNARIEGVPVAGKTGTAQQWSDGSYSKSDYTASFVGMVPADSPSLVVLVMLDRPRTDIYGGSTAAPLFRRIVEAMMGQPSTAMEYKLARPLKGVPAYSDSAIVPDVRGLSAPIAEKMLDVHQLRAHGANALSERHVVVEQQPSPALSCHAGARLNCAPFLSIPFACCRSLVCLPVTHWHLHICSVHVSSFMAPIVSAPTSGRCKMEEGALSSSATEFCQC